MFMIKLNTLKTRSTIVTTFMFCFLFMSVCLVNAQVIAEEYNSLFSRQIVTANDLTDRYSMEAITQKNYYDLLRPLNLIDGDNKVDKNPELFFKGNNQFKNRHVRHNSLFKNDFIPLQFFVNQDGAIDKVEVFTPLLNKPLSSDRQQDIKVFLSEFSGLNVVSTRAEKANSPVAFKTVIALYVYENELMLNPLIH